MPGFQLSIPPWVYDNTTLNITHSMLRLRAQFSSRLTELAREATDTGAPIVRPLWWIAPQDETALTITDEFLFGSQVNNSILRNNNITQ